MGIKQNTAAVATEYKLFPTQPKDFTITGDKNGGSLTGRLRTDGKYQLTLSNAHFCKSELSEMSAALAELATYAKE